MKDIKTREHDRKPKVLEKASRMPKELAKEVGLAAKEKSLQGSRVSDAADHPDSPTGYAGDKVESVLKRGAKESGRTATKVSYAAGNKQPKRLTRICKNVLEQKGRRKRWMRIPGRDRKMPWKRDGCVQKKEPEKMRPGKKYRTSLWSIRQRKIP